ncbi:hypothetical protein CDAR_235041 [Caerostris darwini]|uniref:CASP-like protein n=1 Tax=Caerostris darwini TaxID=1538125 RepID=A0AAV4WAT1_9ARAC|nr:hypothetical protein CDAR_235041 [Caerostris darwini]
MAAAVRMSAETVSVSSEVRKGKKKKNILPVSSKANLRRHKMAFVLLKAMELAASAVVAYAGSRKPAVRCHDFSKPPYPAVLSPLLFSQTVRHS